MAKTGAFENGLPLLSPGRRIHWRIDSLSRLLAANASGAKKFEVTLRYRDIREHGSGKKVYTYEDAFILDVEQFMGQSSFGFKTADKSLEDISKQVSKIATQIVNLQR